MRRQIKLQKIISDKITNTLKKDHEINGPITYFKFVYRRQ